VKPKGCWRINPQGFVDASPEIGKSFGAAVVDLIVACESAANFIRQLFIDTRRATEVVSEASQGSSNGFGSCDATYCQQTG